MKDERSIDGIIDISAKPLVPRLATAEGKVTLSKASVVAIRTSSVAKGDVIEASTIVSPPSCEGHSSDHPPLPPRAH